jgi:hypothetical protein
MTRELRLLFVAFAALAVGAFLLLFVLSNETDTWFSWTIKPPLTAAFLGASYCAALVLFAWTARFGDWRSAQAALVPVSVIAILLLVATIVHEDRFHHDVFGWFWKVAYIVAPIAIAVVVARQLRVSAWERRGPSADHPRTPLPKAVRAALVVQGIVMLGFGAYLFAAPGSADDLWPWPLTPLTARVIGAFVSGFGASALHAVVADDLRSFEGAALAYSTLGVLQLVALALHASDLTGGSGDTWLYVTFLVSVAAIGFAGVRSARGISATA